MVQLTRHTDACPLKRTLPREARMPYKDMPLVCQSCGSPFYFTAGEQEFYADKGFLHEPTRCPKCRSNRPAGGRSAPRSNDAPQRHKEHKER